MNNMKYAILVCLMLPLIALTQVTEKNESTPYWKTLPEPVPTILDYSLKVMFNEPSEEPVTLDWSSIESFWVTLHKKYHPFYIFMTFYTLMILSYIGSGFLFIIIEQLNLFAKYKIQDKINTFDGYWASLRNIGLNYVFVIIPMIIAGFPYFYFIGIRYDDVFPTWFEVLYQNIIFLFGEDFFEYWGHRMLHVPFLYKWIHKEHHQFRTPFGLSASVAHPLETIILGAATFIPAIIVRPHLFTFFVWIELRQLDAVLTHCGYDFPNPCHLLSFYGGTKFHDYHHVSFNFNYASRFTIFDKLFGTYKDPPEAKGSLKVKTK